MPKLNQNNFIAWNKALLNVEYFANWDRDLIDMGQTDDSVWDPDAEEPSEKRRADRRNAFALIRLTVSQELHHLLTGITPGDVKALYKKLYRRFCRLTAGAIQGLKKELASFTMASSGKTVEVYASLLEEKHTLLLKIQGKPKDANSDFDLCNFFMNGLLKPEFSGVVMYLQLREVRELTFNRALEIVTNYAMDQRLLDVHRGKATLLLNNHKGRVQHFSKQVCKKFQQGACSFGNKCRYLHESSKSPSPGSSSYQVPTTSRNIEQKKYKKGTCYECGSSSHLRNKCPKLGRGPPKPEDEAKYSADVKVFAMRAMTNTRMRADEASTFHVTLAHSTIKAFGNNFNTEYREAISDPLIIADGAASHHCCPYAQAFIPSSMTRINAQLEIGDGSKSLTSHWMGTIQLQPRPNLPQINLREVLFVPGCPKLIVSERRFDEGGCAIIKYDRRLTISMPFNEDQLMTNVIMKGRLSRRDHLYHLHCRVIMSKSPSNFGSSNSDSDLPRPLMMMSGRDRSTSAIATETSTSDPEQTPQNGNNPLSGSDLNSRSTSAGSESKRKSNVTKKRSHNVSYLQQPFQDSTSAGKIATSTCQSANQVHTDSSMNHALLEDNSIPIDDSKNCFEAKLANIIPVDTSNGGHKHEQIGNAQPIDKMLGSPSRTSIGDLHRDGVYMSPCLKRPTIDKVGTIFTPPDVTVKVDRPVLLMTNAQVWFEHQARGHQSFAGIRRDFSLPSVPPENELVCDDCLLWKTKNKSIPRAKKAKPRHVTRLLEEVEIDIGHVSCASWNRKHYFQLIVDLLSKKYFIEALTFKSQHFEAFRWIFNRWRIEKPHLALKTLRGGNEYNTKNFQQHAKENGYTIDLVPEHSGKARFVERGIGILRSMMMPMMNRAGTSHRAWVYAIEYAVTILNESTTASLPGQISRNQVWELERMPNDEESVRLPKSGYVCGKFDIFGALAFVRVFPTKKTLPVTVAGIFLGQNDNIGTRNVVRLLDSGRVIATKNAIIDNTKFPCKEAEFATMTQELRAEAPEEVPPDFQEALQDCLSASNAHWEATRFDDVDSLSKSDVNAINAILGIEQAPATNEYAQIASRYPVRVREPSSKALENIATDFSSTILTVKTKDDIYPVKTPKTFAGAVNGPYKEQWERAMHEEMEEIWSQNTYKLVPCPPGVKPIGSRWLYKIKWKHDPYAESPDMAYEILRWKARLIAQGYNQIKGIDYKESYSYTVSRDSIRILICICYAFGWSMYSLDFKNFYLQGTLADAGEKPMYVKQPPGYVVKGKEDWVCEVIKAWYGLPPAGRCAQLRLTNILTGPVKFIQNATEPMMFRSPDTSELQSAYHVDDGIFIASDNEKDRLKNAVNTLDKHGMKGELIPNPSKYVGAQFQYLADNTAVLCHQEDHINKMTANAGLNECNPMPTPMEPGRNRPLEEDILDCEGIQDYQQKCGDLIWMLYTRPEISYAVWCATTRMSKPTEFDLKRAKRIIRYLRGTPRRGLVYVKLSPGADLDTYFYADAALPPGTSYPHCGYAGFLGEPDFINHINTTAAVLFKSKRVRIVVGSSMEGEVVSIGMATHAAYYMADARGEMGIPQRRPTIIFTDNQPAIHFFMGDRAVSSDLSRHLRRRYDFIRQAIDNQAIVLKWVPTKLNCADILTKPLSRELFERHAQNLMGRMPAV